MDDNSQHRQNHSSCVLALEGKGNRQCQARHKPHIHHGVLCSLNKREKEGERGGRERDNADEQEKKGCWFVVASIGNCRLFVAVITNFHNSNSFPS